MTTPFVDVETRGRVRLLRLNRPETRNAIASEADCEDLTTAVTDAERDPATSVLLFTGMGSAFCAGGDLRAIQQRRPGDVGGGESALAIRDGYRRGVQRLMRRLWDCELPMIAAVNGPAMGLGLDLAVVCDLRIAAQSARFASSFIRLGLIPGDGGAWLLPRAIGLARASEMILTGAPIDAAKAEAWGLVSRVVDDAALIIDAWQLAAQLSEQPPRALRLAKRLLREGQQQRFSDVLELSAALQALAHETADHREALEAMLSKRPPRFSGH